ncbi:hypothetical protein [Bacillus smithii]|uniref:hypothetical protein n=1 Tax=Bacillus smithii TaxID=1479 RepID=UPI003D1C876F
MLTNVEKHTIYDIQQNLNKETVVQRLSEISDKYCIKMEMWQPYKDAVKTVHAKLSLIRFK